MHITPHKIAEYSTATRNYIFRSLQVDVDGSEESLAFVDHYINKFRRENTKPDMVVLLAATLGAYFGEVVLQKFKGEWVGVEENEDPALWRVELRDMPLSFSPIGMTATALAAAELDDYDSALTSTPQWQPQLEQALLRMPEVPEDYYYSLTGRFETIQHLADVLVELMHKE